MNTCLEAHQKQIEELKNKPEQEPHKDPPYTKGASYQIAITVKPAFSNGFNAANKNLVYKTLCTRRTSRGS
ncbi:hypothetical protein BVRB_1g022580 [Beta vulgaris subsp. vulgaris]|nr:hypothetical protein BVRB_1g022580 [Beta vulgaris subsp. vulgaris]